MVHDRILDKLENIVKKAEIKYRNLKYGTPETIGEIDLLVYNSRILDLYEVKSNYSMTKKAQLQLDRHQRVYVREYWDHKKYPIIVLNKLFVTGYKHSDYTPIIIPMGMELFATETIESKYR